MAGVSKKSPTAISTLPPAFAIRSAPHVSAPLVQLYACTCGSATPRSRSRATACTRNSASPAEGSRTASCAVRTASPRRTPRSWWREKRAARLAEDGAVERVTRFRESQHHPALHHRRFGAPRGSSRERRPRALRRRSRSVLRAQAVDAASQQASPRTASQAVRWTACVNAPECNWGKSEDRSADGASAWGFGTAPSTRQARILETT